MKLITDITPLNEIIKDETKIQTLKENSNSVVRIPECGPHPKVSLFNSYFDTETQNTVSLWEFLLTNRFSEYVKIYRTCKNANSRNQIKTHLPCITVSGVFDNRSRKSLYHIHSNFICIDIDGKDNNRIFGREWFSYKNKLGELFNSLAYAGMSISGNGLCLIFHIAYPEMHNDHFNALVAEIRERIGLVADEGCRHISRLRGASYDAYPYFNPYAKPYQKVKRSIYPDNYNIPINRTAREQNLIDDKVHNLVNKICSRKIDITDNYQDWFMIGCAFAVEYGKEEGNRLFHRVSMWHPRYYPSDCDEQFAKCLRFGNRTTIKTFFRICKEHGVTFK